MIKIENHPQKLNGKKRSPEWGKIRKAHLAKFPTCAACGGKTKITVHHMKPFHLHPELELDPTNLITLCEGNKDINCHLVEGHYWSFAKRFNVDVIADSEKLLQGKNN